MIPGMGSILHVAHNSVSSLFEGPVEITEKIDGSFISFGIIDGELSMRSKGQELHVDAPSSKMFAEGMRQIDARRSLLVPGWIYRGEYLAKPKHNTLCYNRVPDGNIVLFDIEMRMGNHARALMRRDEARRMGFTPVPVLYEGISNLEHTKTLMDNISCLGGQKVEGVVVKNYAQLINSHIMMGKLVSDEFKEVHTQEWKRSNPAKKDVVETLIESYRVPARWRKAIQHMAEDGTLTNSPRDIGPLLKEISEDVRKEEEEVIKEALFKWAWPQISRGVSRGFADWYKRELINDNDDEIPTDEGTGQDEVEVPDQTISLRNEEDLH